MSTILSTLSQTSSIRPLSIMAMLVVMFGLNLQYDYLSSRNSQIGQENEAPESRLRYEAFQHKQMKNLAKKVGLLETKLKRKSFDIAKARNELKSLHVNNSYDNFLRHAACEDKHVRKRFKTEVVMFIPTPVMWRERRSHMLQQFLREKWKRSQAVLVFVFGTKTGPQLQEDVDISPIEHERVPGVDYYFSSCRDFGDEPNNPNGTSSTTCKVYEACKYISQNYEADYVWRGADDSYVNLKLFFKDKASLPSAPLFLGLRRVAKEPAEDLQLAVGHPLLQELFGIYQFGQYMMGCGYAFSWDVVEFVASWAIPPHQTWCEDVMVGMWLNPFQIRWVDEGARYVRHYMAPAHWALIDDGGVLAGLPPATPPPPAPGPRAQGPQAGGPHDGAPPQPGSPPTS